MSLPQGIKIKKVQQSFNNLNKSQYGNQNNDKSHNQNNINNNNLNGSQNPASFITRYSAIRKNSLTGEGPLTIAFRDLTTINGDLDPIFKDASCNILHLDGILTIRPQSENIKLNNRALVMSKEHEIKENDIVTIGKVAYVIIATRVPQLMNFQERFNKPDWKNNNNNNNNNNDNNININRLIRKSVPLTTKPNKSKKKRKIKSKHFSHLERSRRRQVNECKVQCIKNDFIMKCPGCQLYLDVSVSIKPSKINNNVSSLIPSRTSNRSDRENVGIEDHLPLQILQEQGEDSSSRPSSRRSSSGNSRGDDERNSRRSRNSKSRSKSRSRSRRRN